MSSDAELPSLAQEDSARLLAEPGVPAAPGGECARAITDSCLARRRCLGQAVVLLTVLVLAPAAFFHARAADSGSGSEAASHLLRAFAVTDKAAAAAAYARYQKWANTTAPPARYDCEAGLEDHKAWPHFKKAWCCKTQGKACDYTTSSQLFDCDASFNSWEGEWRTAWSGWKKAWCCKNKNKGCPSDVHELTFDCGAELSSWQTAWSSIKQQWCCSNHAVGCPSNATATAAGGSSDGSSNATATGAHKVELDCDAEGDNYKHAWSEFKLLWCCKHKRKGCSVAIKMMTPHAFNCTNDYRRWRITWSKKKKEWCCKQEKKGCSEAKEPFNCMHGYEDYVTGWTKEKRKWCCKKYNRACWRAKQANYTCGVGDHVRCPGAKRLCAGNQCCPGAKSTETFACPSAADDWITECWYPKRVNCVRHEKSPCAETSGRTMNYPVIMGARWDFTDDWDCHGQAEDGIMPVDLSQSTVNHDLLSLPVPAWGSPAAVNGRKLCAKKCLETPTCVAFNYPDPGNGMCYIKRHHRKSVVRDETCGQKTKWWDYYTLIDRVCTRSESEKLATQAADAEELGKAAMDTKFQALDVDQSEEIEDDEWHGKRAKKLGFHFKSADDDTDGQIDLKEFVEAMEPSTTPAP